MGNLTEHKFRESGAFDLFKERCDNNFITLDDTDSAYWHYGTIRQEPADDTGRDINLYGTVVYFIEETEQTVILEFARISDTWQDLDFKILNSNMEGSIPAIEFQPNTGFNEGVNKATTLLKTEAKALYGVVRQNQSVGSYSDNTIPQNNVVFMRGAKRFIMSRKSWCGSYNDFHIGMAGYYCAIINRFVNIYGEDNLDVAIERVQNKYKMSDHIRSEVIKHIAR